MSVCVRVLGCVRAVSGPDSVSGLCHGHPAQQNASCGNQRLQAGIVARAGLLAVEAVIGTD